LVNSESSVNPEKEEHDVHDDGTSC